MRHSADGSHPRTGTSALTRSIYVTSMFISGDGPRGRSSGTANRHGLKAASQIDGASFPSSPLPVFLNGPGFQKMRAELRRDADEIWIIDCSPEGHQPDVQTRIFQGVQQPVCIVMALRSTDAGSSVQARVRYRALPQGHRTDKFVALDAITLDDDGWTECPSDPRASFFPRSAGAWGEFPALQDLFVYDGSGVMPGRTWVIAPDRVSLERRWGGAAIRSRCWKEGGVVPSAHTGGQTRPQTAAAGTSWS